MATGDKIYFAKKADLDKKLDNTTSASNADKLLSVNNTGNIIFDEAKDFATLARSHAIEIPAYAELDNYQDIGEYYVPSAAVAATIPTVPWHDIGCKITITDNYSGGNIRLMTAQASPCMIAQRYFTNNSGEWGWSNWKYFYATSDTYDSTSTNSMSGKAVSSAISTKLDKTGGTATGNITVNRADGSAGTAGSSTLVLGNSTLQSKAKNSRGWIQLYGTGNAASGATQEYYARLQTGAITAARYYTFGDRSGEVAVRDAAIDVSGCTLGSNIVKYGAIVCTKTNGVCTVVASLSCSAAIAQGATIFTLPSGYRPKSEMSSHPVLMTNSSGAPGGQAVAITTAGKVLVNNSCASGNRIYMTLTFLV